MPVLTLSFMLGALLTKIARALIQHVTQEKRESKMDGGTTAGTSGPTCEDLYDSMDDSMAEAPDGRRTTAPLSTTQLQSHTSLHYTAAASTEDGKMPSDLKAEEGRRVRDNTDPCKYICRFPNEFNNCWMNASLQATLNLDVVQEKLMHQTPETLMQLSSMPPSFAELLVTALQKPGRSFSSRELHGILIDLSLNMSTLNLFQANCALDFIEPLLSWFDQCGIRTALWVKSVCSCEKCDFASTTVTLHSMFSLPLPSKWDSIYSLVKCVSSDSQSQCITCGSTSTIRHFWTCPDILTFYLPQNDAAFRKILNPSELIEINVGGNRKQTYKLSSVICYTEGDTTYGHIYTYLFSDHITIEADDNVISYTDRGRPKEVYKDGYIYFYEMLLPQHQFPCCLPKQLDEGPKKDY